MRTKRLTAEQRRERDFWLGCAERAYLRVRRYNLCAQRFYEPGDYGERLDLFAPHGKFGFWWDYDGMLGYFKGQDGHEGRVLAACFLAAMAELGE